MTVQQSDGSLENTNSFYKKYIPKLNFNYDSVHLGIDIMGLAKGEHTKPFVHLRKIASSVLNISPPLEKNVSNWYPMSTATYPW